MRKSTRSAFTLVELIVVITILAVLGTIAFISLQGYSADARNTKRSSDLSSITSAMSIKTAEGGSLTAFVKSDAATAVSGATYGWKTATLNTDYFAGIPNYTALGVKADEFKDPNGQDYRIGVTTTSNGKFELAASKEEGAEKVALVKGTYDERTADLLNNTGGIAQISGNIVTLKAADTNAFQTGDVVNVTWGTNPQNNLTIKKVSRDGITLNFGATDITTDQKTVTLADDETDGLISIRGGTSTTSVQNWTTGAANQPY